MSNKEPRNVRKAKLAVVKGRASNPQRRPGAIVGAIKDATKSGVRPKKVRRVAQKGAKIREQAAAGKPNAIEKQNKLAVKHKEAFSVIDANAGKSKPVGTSSDSGKKKQ